MIHRIAALTTTLVVLISMGACGDLNEGPAEELREAADAIEEGQPARQIAEEAGDVFERRSAAEKRLNRADAWLDQRREEIQSGANDMGDDAEARLNRLAEKVAKAREDVSDTTREWGDDIERNLDQIEAEIQDAF